MNEPEAHVSSWLQQRAEQDAQFSEDMWRFRHPEEGGEKLTLEAILVELDVRYKKRFSLDTLSRFYRWLGLCRRFQEKRSAISQILEEAAKDPNISEEQIKKMGRRLFLTESVVEKDAKVFADMVKIGQTDTSLAQRDRDLDQRESGLKQREKLVAQSERKLAMLERKAANLESAEAAIKQVQGDKTLSAEEQRAAVIDKMDEFFGLKKKH